MVIREHLGPLALALVGGMAAGGTAGAMGGLMGGGGDAPTAKTTTRTSITNKQSLENTQDLLVKNIQESFMENMNASSMALDASQKVLMKGLRAKGNITIGEVNMDQYAKVNFDSLNTIEIQEKAANKMTNTILNEIVSKADADTKSKMKAKVKALGGIFGKAPPAGSETKDIFEQHNEIDLKIKNKIHNIAVNRSKKINVQECAQSLRTSQDVEYIDIEAGGNLNVGGINMTQAAEAVAKCKSVQSTSTEVINDVINSFDLKSTQESKTKRVTDQSAETVSEDGLMKAVNTFASAFANAAMILPLIIGVVILIVLYKMIGGGGSSKQKKQIGGLLTKDGDINPLIILLVVFVVYKLKF